MSQHPIDFATSLERLIQRLADQAHAEIAAPVERARREVDAKFSFVARSNGQRFRFARQPRKST